MATEKLCATVAKVKQMQTTKDRHHDDTTRKEGRCTWRDVAKDGASSDHPKPRALDWVAARTFFLKARDRTWAVRSMPNFEFGAQVDRLLRALPRLKDKPVLVERVVRTSVGDWKVQVADDCTYELETCRDMAVPDMGRWVVEKMRPLTQASLVIRDIPVEAIEQQVAEVLYMSNKYLMNTADKEQFKQLRASRLFTCPRREGGATNDGDGQATRGTPTRSVRIFLPTDLINKALNHGHLMFRWSVCGVRPYVPKSFYCKICGKLGSHAMQFHRKGPLGAD